MRTLPPAPLPESGIYVVRMDLRRPVTLTVGALGPVRFEPGSYLYVGSAARGLPSRVARHARRDKPLRWHIDYLTAHSPAREAWAWAGDALSECAVAVALAVHLDPVPGFGASDCRCRTHLFRIPPGVADWLGLAGLPPPSVSISLRPPARRNGK